MPIVFAHLIGLSLGGLFAWVAAPDLARSEKPPALTPAFALVVAFAAFIWFPMVGYFAFFHRDWSYLYLVAHHPSAIDLALAILAAACVAGAFLVVAKPARKRRLGPAFAAIAAPAAMALAALPFALSRLSVSATYAQFHGDFGTEPIGSSLLGKAVLVLGVLATAAVAWTVRALTHLSPPPP
jgi:hypothetical protein